MFKFKTNSKQITNKKESACFIRENEFFQNWQHWIIPDDARS